MGVQNIPHQTNPPTLDPGQIRDTHLHINDGDLIILSLLSQHEQAKLLMKLWDRRTGWAGGELSTVSICEDMAMASCSVYLQCHWDMKRQREPQKTLTEAQLRHANALSLFSFRRTSSCGASFYFCMHRHNMCVCPLKPEWLPGIGQSSGGQPSDVYFGRNISCVHARFLWSGLVALCIIVNPNGKKILWILLRRIVKNRIKPCLETVHKQSAVNWVWTNALIFISLLPRWFKELGH